uniref:KTSC domain-containing protein n=1 Tax=Caenorhabditis tropicalis TaxID=1561998 RepID=A0A1I7U353_9PELO
MKKLYFLSLLINFLLATVQNGGWTTEEKDVVPQNKKCNIERHDARELTQKEFLKRYAYSEPVIIYNVNNEEFKTLTEKSEMLSTWRDVGVTLNSANTYSYTRVPTTFGKYIEEK